jgi:cyclomaltodextrinase
MRSAENVSARVLAAFLLLTVALLSAPRALALEPAAQPPARQSPAWLRDAVIYEVFPRDFSPEGNFDGVARQLDRLKDLGVTVIWLMPIHPVGKLKSKGTLGSPYAVRDYDAINAEYGSADDLRRLIDGAHRRQMKVLIDIVANHTSWDSVLIEKHPDWYHHDASGKIVPPNPDWVDVAHLDYSNAALRQYMTGMMVRWVRDFGLDGFRCDYAAGVPRDYWESLRAALDQARPGTVLLAEADDPALLVRAFDIDYSWDFFHATDEVVRGHAAASTLRDIWERAAARYPRGALRLRFFDNHDELRATARAGLPAALAASALMFTLDGVPLLYNGMEVGDTTESAAPALFERMPIAWSMAERRPQVSPYYRALSNLRHSHPALTRGALRWLRNSDEQHVVSFERADATGSLLAVINLSSQSFAGVVESDRGSDNGAALADYRDVTPRGLSGDLPQSRVALPAVFLGPWEFRVYSRGPAK